MSGDGSDPSFSGEFDHEFAIGAEEGNRAFFGRDVLRGLVEGIDDYVQLQQPRWRHFRAIGPALLGSALWIDDQALMDKLGGLSGASIVVPKQGRKDRALRKLEPLHALNERTPGMPIRALPGLSGLAPKVDGKPLVVGPSTPMDEGVMPTIRTLGYRKRGRHLPPIVHAKLALLGHLWWHDGTPSGARVAAGVSRATVQRWLARGRTDTAGPAHEFARDHDALRCPTPASPLTEADLTRILEARARGGNVDAIRLLLARSSRPAPPAPPPPLSVIDTVAAERRTRS